jgi:hypothetical protein
MIEINGGTALSLSLGCKWSSAGYARNHDPVEANGNIGLDIASAVGAAL